MTEALFPEERIRLSVVMAVLDAAETIGVQLEALARQRWAEAWELLVVDNGCSDDSMRIVEQFRGRIPVLRMLRATDQQSAAHARNAGVRAARGGYLAFCDADDEVADDWLENIATAVERYQFVASRMDAARLSSPRGLGARGNGLQKEGLIPYRYVPFLPFAGTSGLAIQRELHEQVSGFDESLRFLEDCDYCWRVQLAGTPLVFAPEALVYIRHRDNPYESFRQARNWGEYNVLLLKRYRAHGMPPPDWKKGLRLWWGLLRMLPTLRKQANRDRFLWSLGYRIGHVRGSIRQRTFAP